MMLDLVSRGEVAEALITKGLESKRYERGEKWELNCEEILEALHDVPSKYPGRQQGKWMVWNSRVTKGTLTQCLVCGSFSEHYDSKWHYWPSCGAEMEVK